MYKAIFLFISVILLNACKNPQESFAPNQDDLNRIGRILSIMPQPLTESKRVRTTLPPGFFSETRVGFADALSLGKCGLIPLIADRNSSLGRQKKASFRFIYEWRVQKGLRNCREQFSSQPWFQKAMTAKSNDLKVATMRLLFASQEATILQTTLPSHEPYSLRKNLLAYREAFTRLRTIILSSLTDKNVPDEELASELEIALKRWAATGHHGILSQSLRETLDWLKSANTMQALAIRQNAICPMKQTTPAGKRVLDFVAGYYGDRIRPKLVNIVLALDSFETLWNPIIQVNTRLTVDDVVNHQLMLESGTRTELKSALETHINQWQKILGDCQLAPRASTTNS
jgi:hypothetical protein|tara:strand:- start:4297 stop:5328 length:1032 start_codon:yes stop_codon:yes gene_type:complete